MTILHGDSADTLKQLEDNSVDSVVTDPPYYIGFMGKNWDVVKGRQDAIDTFLPIFKQTYRVLKPGGHACVFALPRTSHWTGLILEDAGFELRDCIHWTFSTGFPKSMNVGLALDKLNGVESKVVGSNPNARPNSDVENNLYRAGTVGKNCDIKAAQNEWAGWGTALKPAHEVIWLVRKPLSEPTIAKNVLKHGTGAINIDASRVGIEGDDDRSAGNRTKTFGKIGDATSGGEGSPEYVPNPTGRFPANFILECVCEDKHTNPECPCVALDKQYVASKFFKQIETNIEQAPPFYYCAKPSKRERNTGLEGGVNTHPTVKPLKLLKYLITLITPPGGTVLDMFAGSGSTGIAVNMLNGEGCEFEYVLCELEDEYIGLIEKRLKGETQ